MKRLLLLISLLCSGFVVGCVTQGELQALRADVAALERTRAQQKQEVSSRLEALDTRLERPDVDMRRELAQNLAATEELRVEVQGLRGKMQELQHGIQNGVGPSAEMRDIFATKLAELETRLAALEQRVDPQGRAALRLPTEPRPPGTPPAAPTPSRVTAIPSAPATRPPATSSPPQPALQAGADEAADRLYQRARKEYKAGNYEVAIVLFKQLLRQHPQTSLAGNGQYWLGESLYAQQQFEAAIVAFDEVVQKYAKNSKVPAAILKQGYAFDALDDKRNARFFLQQVQRKYPDSPEAQQAEKRLKELQ
ncbi:MAG: tol-pal system protein YbgF [Candidatus Tectomicrobia bacterium]|nr:tol-pal system protein YbgF [Candidatus Tectomicrobia bacterium]